MEGEWRMRTERFISIIMQFAKEKDNIEELRRQVPLGLDMAGEIVTSQRRNGPVALKHICVTGSKRVEYICNLLITLSCLYDKEEANFIILSPRTKYAELLGLRSMDVIVPYVRTKDELESLLFGLRDLVNMYSRGKGYPHLFLVVDGLEELPDCNVNEELKEYNDLFASLARRPNVEIISGVNLMKSIYSGCPGAFVGIGNCLVSTREDGKADVTYVGEGTNLSLPILIDFACEPSVAETIQFLNGVAESGFVVAEETPTMGNIGGAGATNSAPVSNIDNNRASVVWTVSPIEPPMEEPEDFLTDGEENFENDAPQQPTENNGTGSDKKE